MQVSLQDWKTGKQFLNSTLHVKLKTNKQTKRRQKKLFFVLFPFPFCNTSKHLPYYAGNNNVQLLSSEWLYPLGLQDPQRLVHNIYLWVNEKGKLN